MAKRIPIIVQLFLAILIAPHIAQAQQTQLARRSLRHTAAGQPLTISVASLSSSPCDTATINIATPPAHGNASITYPSADSLPHILYQPTGFPTAGNAIADTTCFSGIDSMQVVLSCNTADTFWLRILVGDMPANIVDDHCSLPAPSSAVTLHQLYTSPGVNGMTTPLVADMDGDGLPEIIAIGYNTTSRYACNSLKIINGQTGELIRSITTDRFRLSGQCIAIADVDGDHNAEIFILTQFGETLCYNHDGTIRWRNTTIVPRNYVPTLADINADGIPELICGTHIFNAVTGTLLLAGTMSTNGTGYATPHGTATDIVPYYLYSLADMDGDAKPEIVAGNSVYTLTLASGTDTTGNRWQTLRQANITDSVTNADGQTIIADFDGDGDLDVCVLGVAKTLGNPDDANHHSVSLYIWDGQTSDILAHTEIAMDSNFGPSLPACDDIDLDGRPDILFNLRSHGLTAFTLDTTQPGNLRNLFTINSLGETTAPVIFDLDGDGTKEIICRTRDSIHIIKPSDQQPLCTPVALYSGTLTEYPVVADINGDGHAEIIATGDTAYWPNTGSIVTFAATTAPIGSALPLWNQWAYNPILVNADLTIPSHPIARTSTLPNGTRPYNSFLSQPPLLDLTGAIYNPAADLVADSITAYEEGDSVTLTVTISNLGSIASTTPIWIAYYIDDNRGQLICSDSINVALAPDSSAVATTRVDKATLCLLNSDSRLAARVNDNGSVMAGLIDRQPECDTSNNSTWVSAPFYHNSGDTAATACDSLVWWGNNYNISTNAATHTFTNITGCDSTVTLNLTILHSTTSDTTATACDSFAWWGHPFTTSTDTATRTLPNANAVGCDSTIALHLTINQSNTYDTIATACDSLNWWGNSFTTTTDTATRLLPNANAAGCDSTVTLHLTISHSTTGDTNAAACDSFTWWGTNYTTSTETPSHSYANAAGCDSTVTLHLTINHSNTGDTNATGCDSFTWWDNEFTASTNTATRTLPNANAAGCDSTVALHLTINHTSSSTDSIRACDRFLWLDGVEYAESTNTPTLHLTNRFGCDSTVTLDLTILHSAIAYIADSFCVNTSYTFGDNELTYGGIFFDTLSTHEGCDSIVRLDLTMLTTPNIDISRSHDCQLHMHYINASSNVTRLHWEASQSWDGAWGPQDGASLAISTPHTMTLTVTADYEGRISCPNTATVTVDPIIQPEAIIEVKPEFLTSDNLTLSAFSHSTGSEWLQWYIDDTEAGTATKIEYTVDSQADSVRLMLVATNTMCADSAWRTVYVKRSSIFAPDVFTPSEATNNRFGLFCDGVTEYNLRIYNRGGQQVFQSTDPDESWDGTYRGKSCPQGAYVWVLTYRSEEDPQDRHVSKGSVLLIR